MFAFWIMQGPAIATHAYLHADAFTDASANGHGRCWHPSMTGVSIGQDSREGAVQIEHGDLARAGTTADPEAAEDEVAVGETVILLHPHLP